MRCWSPFLCAAMAFAPNSRTASPCGGGRCLFRRQWHLAPNSHTTSPCGGCRSLFFASAKKTNEKKADPAGSRAIRLMWGGGCVVRPGVLAGESYRTQGHRNGITQWSRGAAPDLVCGDHSHICRSRGEVLRRFGCGWFRGFVSEGERRGCKRGARARATVPTTKPGELVARCRSRRYGRASNGRAPAARDKTTKPPRQARSWRYAPRTADARTRTAQSDQGHHHVTIWS